MPNLILDSQLTPQQRMSLGQIHRRNSDGPETYREFRETVIRSCDCVMVPWAGMWLGIEPDGYTHS